jgi:hypothetical protein
LPNSVSDAFALNDGAPDKHAREDADPDAFEVAEPDAFEVAEPDGFALEVTEPDAFEVAEPDAFALEDADALEVAGPDADLDFHTAHSRVKSAEARSPFGNQRFSFLGRVVIVSPQIMN